MNDYMAQQMDDEIQRGIELRDSIDEHIQSFGWLPEESIPYEDCVIMIAQFYGK